MPFRRRTYHTYRRHWWLRPLVLLPVAFLLLLAVPMFLWIHTYGSTAADVMFSVTYISLCVWVVYLMRGTILEPHIRRNEGAVAEERVELEKHRAERRRAVYAKELELLANGEMTTVLDAWSMDASIRSSNPVVGRLRTCRIDPARGEWEICVVVEVAFPIDDEQQRGLLVKHLRGFLRMFAKHADVRLFRPYADTLAFVVFRTVDDGGLTGTPEPMFSLLTPFAELEAWADQPPSGVLPGEVRFDDGAPVEAHRDIPTGGGRGAK